MDEQNMLMVAGVLVALAPGWAMVWIAIAKQTLEMFQTADTQAITEKVNPNIVPK